ncbi:hypothetical protein phiK7A1_062 [Pseudomonas phage phiK7A1]|uniref:Tail fiber protein n=1 Tax=Pseudomonas phage phiK7A1 TaxID=2759194 RepID=A0A7H0XFR0_9CAUD|nr:hypothetical protein phiK7A1_062 [Pseudomonas phage phiK7A1]
MTLQTQIIALVEAIGFDIADLKYSNGDLASLSTTAQDSLVSAINEVFSLVGSGSGGVTINDASTTSTTETWSASKSTAAIAAAIAALQNSLVDGAGAALDTLKELQDALGGDANFATTVATALGNRVRFDSPQLLSAPQKTQVLFNIGVGDPDHDYVADYEAAKAAA